MSRLSYVNYSFEDIVIQLQDRLKLTNSWADIYRSGTGETLIELLAYVLEAGLYYTERRAVESYLPLAQNISSVRHIVALLNYQPKRKTSSTGTLTFSIPAALGVNVFIPKYTECQSSSGTKYITNEDSVIEKGSTSVAVNAIQGSISEVEIVSNGLATQEYLINSTSVENSTSEVNPTMRVLVGSVLWTKVDSFINSDSESKHYKVINEAEGTVTVQFGDNVNGMAPANSSTISIKYVKSDGVDGNVSNTGVITTLNSTIYDEDGSAVTTSVTNSSSFFGGDDEEGIEEIRYEAPRVFKTGQRAVSKDDFIAILENYAGVANVNVWGENEEALDSGVDADYEMLNKVKMCVLLQEWELPDATFKTALSSYIYGISMLTVKYEFVEPVILNVVPKISVKVLSGYSLSQTQSDVEAAVLNEFELGVTTKLGSIIKYSHLVNAIDDVVGVSYANMTLEIRKDLEAEYQSAWDYGETLDAIPVKEESARLYIDDEYITVDDGSGVFSYSGTYEISGTIDYETGVVVLDVSPVPASSIYIRYQQSIDSGGSRDITPSLRQICKLYDNDTTISME